MSMRKKPISGLIGLVIGLASLGLSPAYAVDQRVIDVVEVTWPGAVAPVGDSAAVAKVIDQM